MLWSCLVISTILQLLCCYSWSYKRTYYMGAIYNIDIPQAVDACAEYPVTHYILNLTRRSVVNQSILMQGPSSINGASKIEMALNSTDDILQNVRYHFQISAVNIIGSSTSSEMEFCKSLTVLTCTCYQSISWFTNGSFLLIQALHSDM